MVIYWDISLYKETVKSAICINTQSLNLILKSWLERICFSTPTFLYTWLRGVLPDILQQTEIMTCLELWMEKLIKLQQTMPDELFCISVLCSCGSGLYCLTNHNNLISYTGTYPTIQIVISKWFMILNHSYKKSFF